MRSSLKLIAIAYVPNCRFYLGQIRHVLGVVVEPVLACVEIEAKPICFVEERDQAEYVICNAVTVFVEL